MRELEWMKARRANSRRQVSEEQMPEPQSGAAVRILRSVLRRYTERNERLRVCETLLLGGRRSVALIECDGQRFLAGMSAGGVETLVPVPNMPARGDLQ